MSDPDDFKPDDDYIFWSNLGFALVGVLWVAFLIEVAWLARGILFGIMPVFLP